MNFRIRGTEGDDTSQISEHQYRLQQIKIHWPIIRKGAIETELRPNNVNTGEGLFFSKSWKSLFYPLEERRKPSSEDMSWLIWIHKRWPFSGTISSFTASPSSYCFSFPLPTSLPLLYFIYILFYFSLLPLISSYACRISHHYCAVCTQAGSIFSAVFLSSFLVFMYIFVLFVPEDFYLLRYNCT
jgi:hypothetical protein